MRFRQKAQKRSSTRQCVLSRIESWDRLIVDKGLPQPHAFIREKEKRMVAPHGPAERCGKLLLALRRPAIAMPVGKPIVRAQHFVPEPLEHRAVPLFLS